MIILFLDYIFGIFMRGLKAFIITLLIYILLGWLYFTQLAHIKPTQPKVNNHRVKIDIRNIPDPIVQKTQAKPEIQPKPIPKPQPIIKKPVKKKIVKKKVIKKKPKKKKIVKKKIKKKKIRKKKKIVKKKKRKKVKKKKRHVKKKKSKKRKVITRKKSRKKVRDIKVEDMPYIPDPFLKAPREVESFPEPVVRQPQKQPKKSSDGLASFLGTPSPSAPAVQSFPSRKIQKLYGSTFHRFTPTQKKFIKNNLESIQRITQNILTRRGYPEGAGRTGQEGTNVVEFYLHPNGDITNLRLKQRIGYRALDDNTISLIRVAYKDYPYPSTTTKIIFYVTYSIYGY